MGIKFFGQYLLEKGKITRESLLKAVELQKDINVSIGTIALEKGFLTPAQINKIHQEQYRTDKKFGEIAQDFGFLTAEQLQELLDAQMSRRLYLGEALVRIGALTLEELEESLKTYVKEQEREEEDLQKVLKGVKNAEVVSAFIDLVIKMFLRLARQIVKVSACHQDKTKINIYDYTIVQKISGQININFILNMSSELLLKTAEKMINKEVKQVDAFTMDAVKEFVNITTGNACSKLSSSGLKLRSQPPTIYDNSTSLKYPIEENKEVVVVPFLSTVGQLEVGLGF